MIAEKFLISWNNRFPKDRIYRKKYNIPFGSQQHKDTSQIDAFLDVLEDTLYQKHIDMYKREKEALETYKNTGKWLKESTLDEKEFDELFDSVDVTKFNKQ